MLLNDFAFVAWGHTYEGALAVDYGSRILSLAILLAVPDLRSRLRGLFARRDPWAMLLIYAVALAAVFLVMDEVTDSFELEISRWTLYSFPDPSSPWLHALDLTVGLALVAVSEEMVFRGGFLVVLERIVPSPIAVVAISTLVFSVAHWGRGFDALVDTAVAGAVWMAVFAKRRSFWTVMPAHYLTDIFYYV
jgi:hypothetical protein